MRKIFKSMVSLMFGRKEMLFLILSKDGHYDVLHDDKYFTLFERVS